jgi:hypothetical protein
MSRVVTPWFDGEKFKPVRVGVYETKSVSRSPIFRFWNGEFWGLKLLSKREAHRFQNLKSCVQDADWRGLAINPNEGAKL